MKNTKQLYAGVAKIEITVKRKNEYPLGFQLKTEGIFVKTSGDKRL